MKYIAKRVSIGIAMPKVTFRYKGLAQTLPKIPKIVMVEDMYY